MTKKQRRLNRRVFLRQSAASVLAAGLWPGACTARAAAGNTRVEPFDFVVVNDTHYRDERCGEYLSRTFGHILARVRRPDLILLAGDLATDGRQNELGPMKDILSAVKCPVHVTPGNHDYEPNQSGERYDAIFPGQRNYVVDHKGWIILSYDSTQHVKWQDVAVQPESLAWLDRILSKLDKGRPMIVFTHFPLGDGVPMRSTNGDAVLRRFEKHNLRAVFTGHFHGLTEKQYQGIPVCSNRCMSFSRGNHDGSTEKGYFTARAEPETVSYEFRECLPQV